MEKKIGFIGLGIMGKPMSINLIKGGYQLTVFDINKEAVDSVVKAGARKAESVKEVAEKCNIIFTMLPATQHVKEVVLGANGIIKGAKEGTIVIDMSSITPVDSKEIAGKLLEKGIEMLDAPVSGGEPKAIDGTLAIMVGGKEEVFEAVKDMFYSMGQDVTLVGETGSGTTAKLANQIIVNLNIAAVSEAFVLAAKAGIDVEKMYKAIRGGLAGSTVLDAKAPMMMERNFVPGGSIFINHKDIANVMETAHVIGVPLTLTSQLLEIFKALKVEGKEGIDHSGIVQYYEKLANVEVRKGN